ncbi:MAG: hypothetical protein H6947_06255 [Zoogloeaceae bacterium]|nr:hypothetical protein [Zoogloeaceae bacterium]
MPTPDTETLLMPFEPTAVPVWVDAETLADLAGIEDRNARLALAKCSAGGTWRQHALKVRTKDGGPANAQNPYLVHVESLPPALRMKYMEQVSSRVVTTPIKPGPMVDMPAHVDINAVRKITEMEWKLKIIAPAMDFSEGSPARAEALREIARKKHLGLDGKPKVISVRTLQSWLTRIKREESVFGLMRRPRVDKSERHLICRIWDKNCPLEPETKRQIAREIETYVRSMWAAGAPGWRAIEEYASSKLLELSRASGWSAAAYELCRVGRHYVDKHSETKLIAIKEKDSKRWFDEFVPRAKRSREDYRPGDIVVGDVHPVDVLVTRTDGTEATYRLIAWLDIATGDLFCSLVLLEAGKGINQADTASSFAAMVESWGLPRLLMLDNGSEYSWGELERGFKELAALASSWRHTLNVFTREDDDAVPFLDEASDEIDGRESPILRALPHRPCSKPIEGIFAVLEQNVLKQFPGWIGGDRMNKRTHQMGKAPNPFPGTPAQFEQAFRVALAYWRTRERKSLGGRSIDMERLRFQTDGGRLPPSVPRGALVFALSELLTRRAGSWGVEVAGKWYRSPEIVKRMGQKVTIRYAKWAPEYVFIVDDAGRPVRVDLLPVDNYTDGSGTKHQGKANAVLNVHVRELKATTRKVDMLAEMSRHVAAVGLDVPVLKGPQIELGREMQAVTAAAQLQSEAQETEVLGYGEVLDRSTGEKVSTIPDHYTTRTATRHDYEDDDTDWAAIAARFAKKEELDETAISPSSDDAVQKTGTD